MGIIVNSLPDNVDLVFINLTTGLEWIDEAVSKYGIGKMRFIRIPSSWCETRKLNKVLDSVSDEFLLYLALGYRLAVLDTSSRRGYVSAAQVFGVQYVEYVTDIVWGYGEREYLFTKPTISYSITRMFREHYSQIPKSTFKRIRYYSKYDTGEKKQVYLVCRRSLRDGDYAWYRKKLMEILMDRKAVLASSHRESLNE